MGGRVWQIGVEILLATFSWVERRKLADQNVGVLSARDLDMVLDWELADMLLLVSVSDMTPSCIDEATDLRDLTTFNVNVNITRIYK